MHASLILLDVSSETPEGLKARAAISAGRIGLYSPKEPTGKAAASTPEVSDAPLAGTKRKAGAKSTAAASGPTSAKAASASKKR